MIVRPEELHRLTPSGLSGRDFKIGITSGCFDLLHFYHLHFFERCKAECDMLIVGVDSDELVVSNKSKRPVIPEFHRVALVAGLACVDAAFIMRNLDDLQRAINATFAAKLFKNSLTVYGQPVMEGSRKTDVKPDIVIIPDVAELTSTSQIIASIRGSGIETQTIHT